MEEAVIHADDVVAAARTIRDEHDAWSSDFHKLTARAKARFERREWTAGQHDSVDRLAVYQTAVERTVEALHSLWGLEISRQVWGAAKAAFLEQVAGRRDAELAMTFFSLKTSVESSLAVIVSTRSVNSAARGDFDAGFRMVVKV